MTMAVSGVNRVRSETLHEFDTLEPQWAKETEPKPKLATLRESIHA